jgi:hypothetical protein
MLRADRSAVNVQDALHRPRTAGLPGPTCANLTPIGTLFFGALFTP